LTPESPLFEDSQGQGKFVTLENFERVWYRLLKRSGLADKTQKWYLLYVHTLRKYFRSNCVGVDPTYRETWMGHKGGYLDDSYFRAEEPMRLAEYRKVIPHLTIYPTPNVDEKKQAAQAAKAQFVTSPKARELSPEHLTDHLKKIDEIFARAKETNEGFQGFKVHGREAREEV